MTDTGTFEETNAAPDPWRTEFDRLRSRFPKVQDTVLFCIHALQQDEDIRLDDLKARARLHGLNVTGASLHAARRLLGLEASTSRKPAATPADDRWESAREALAAEFPRTREGILYAVFRLRQDPSLNLPDIRDGAEAAGVKIGGRSLHSARALLAEESSEPTAQADRDHRSLAGQVRELLAQVESDARGEAARLRAAIEEAARVLQEALKECDERR